MKTVSVIPINHLEYGMKIARRDRHGDYSTKNPIEVRSITGPHRGIVGSCNGIHVNTTMCFDSKIGSVAIVEEDESQEALFNDAMEFVANSIIEFEKEVEAIKESVNS